MTSNVVAKNSLMRGKFTRMVKILPKKLKNHPGYFVKVHMNTLNTKELTQQIRSSREMSPEIIVGTRLQFSGKRCCIDVHLIHRSPRRRRRKGGSRKVCFVLTYLDSHDNPDRELSWFFGVCYELKK